MATTASPALSPHPNEAKSLMATARFLRAISDPTRLAICLALIENEHTVSELVELLGVPRSRVSNHLACLKWCGIVESIKTGKFVAYRLAKPRIAEIFEVAGELASGNAEHLATCKRIGPDWI